MKYEVISLRKFLDTHNESVPTIFKFCVDDYFGMCNCSGSADFIKRYGTFAEHFLDEYLVINYSILDNMLNQIYYLKLELKEVYEEREATNVTYTKVQSEIINHYVNATMDALVGNFPILDVGSGWNAMERVPELLDKLSYKDKNKIRSIVLGINYKKWAS